MVERADVVIGDRFVINRVTGLPMEDARVVAHGAGPAHPQVWSSTQVPYLLRRQLSQALRMPEAQIRVIAPGSRRRLRAKLGVYPEDVLACLHSIDRGRPVKWIEDRMEHFRATTHAREAVHETQLAANRDGTILALRERVRGRPRGVQLAASGLRC